MVDDDGNQAVDMAVGHSKEISTGQNLSSQAPLNSQKSPVDRLMQWTARNNKQTDDVPKHKIKQLPAKFGSRSPNVSQSVESRQKQELETVLMPSENLVVESPGRELESRETFVQYGSVESQTGTASTVSDQQETVGGNDSSSPPHDATGIQAQTPVLAKMKVKAKGKLAQTRKMAKGHVSVDGKHTDSIPQSASCAMRKFTAAKRDTETAARQKSDSIRDIRIGGTKSLPKKGDAYHSSEKVSGNPINLAAREQGAWDARSSSSEVSSATSGI